MNNNGKDVLYMKFEILMDNGDTYIIEAESGNDAINKVRKIHNILIRDIIDVVKI